MSKWYVKKCSADEEKLRAFYGCEKPLAYALYNRKIRNRDELKKYSSARNYDFEPITDLKGVSEAFDIISASVKNGEKIYIYGDYDVDGVMSTSIMYKGLKALGADVHYFIPDRAEDGYGMNERALSDIIDKGAELVIACDNGISAIAQIDYAKKRGVKVIVLDHHEPAFEETPEGKRDILPSADAVADAKIQHSGYGFSQMCAGGLCFRFICGLYEHMGKRLKNKNELLELACVATICDVVDLLEDNRAIALQGLELISKGSSNLGLRTLAELKELKKITAYTVGFVIGPCINASGRLDSAAVAVELFITEDKKRARELARILSDFNEERKSITVTALERISEAIENSSLINDKIIVVYDKDTHESVAGIIAGRLKERFNRPAIVITRGEECCKGSGRSVESYDLFKGLYAHKELMLKFGGHTMAAGLSIAEENIDALRTALNAGCELEVSDMEPIYRLETVLRPKDITLKAAEELEILEPFGKANEKPLFGIKNAKAEQLRLVGAEGNIASFFVTDGTTRIRAVDFDNGELWSEVMLSGAKPSLDAVFYIEVNEYKGYKNPQLVIKDVRLH